MFPKAQTGIGLVFQHPCGINIPASDLNDKSFLTSLNSACVAENWETVKASGIYRSLVLPAQFRVIVLCFSPLKLMKVIINRAEVHLGVRIH